MKLVKCTYNDGTLINNGSEYRMFTIEGDYKEVDAIITQLELLPYTESVDESTIMVKSYYEFEFKSEYNKLK